MTVPLAPLATDLLAFLEPYLPTASDHKPFITLTYAQSLDSRIAAEPGTQTKISHPQTKTMTHYLRSKHDAIMVGIGTVLADDPKLNCRYQSGNSPVPVILDPHGKWQYHKSQLRVVCDNNQGLPPIIITNVDTKYNPEMINVLDKQGGKVIRLNLRANDNWLLIIDTLYKENIQSIMIEGGATIINELLVYRKQGKSLINSVIITIGSIYLGKQGVEVSPMSRVDLNTIKWWSGIQDSVMCGKVSQT